MPSSVLSSINNCPGSEHLAGRSEMYVVLQAVFKAADGGIIELVT